MREHATIEGRYGALFFASCLALLGLLSACAGQQKTASFETLKTQLIAAYVGEFRSGPAAAIASDPRAIIMQSREVLTAESEPALFVELRYDDAEKTLYRQRMYVFSAGEVAGEITMRALAFADPEQAALLMQQPRYLLSAALQVTEPLGPGCAMRWQKSAEAWTGNISPERCLITGKRGNQLRIEAITILRADAIGQLERGFDMQGKRTFGSDGAQLNWWRRTRTAIP
jgi:hypothetical protein